MSDADGCFNISTTVPGSFASIASTFFQRTLPSEATCPHRLSEATTSADVISLPVWNFTPRRSVIV
jgi:hypothetical protein